MPSYIVKMNPEEDFYVYFSTIVDNITHYGTKAELIKDLGSEVAREDWWERADANGSSSQLWHGEPLDCGWDEDQLLIRNEVGAAESNWLKRSDLRAFCETNDLSLLRPIHYDDNGDEILENGANNEV